MVTLIYIEQGKPYENSQRFYQFANCHQLGYIHHIRVETPKGETIHEKITVQDYLKTIAE